MHRQHPAGWFVFLSCAQTAGAVGLVLTPCLQLYAAYKTTDNDDALGASVLTLCHFVYRLPAFAAFGAVVATSSATVKADLPIRPEPRGSVSASCAQILNVLAFVSLVAAYMIPWEGAKNGKKQGVQIPVHLLFYSIGFTAAWLWHVFQWASLRVRRSVMVCKTNRAFALYRQAFWWQTLATLVATVGWLLASIDTGTGIVSGDSKHGYFVVEIACLLLYSMSEMVSTVSLMYLQHIQPIWS